MFQRVESFPLKRRRLRFNLGLSRSEFARFLGVSDATVVRWEADDSASEPKGLEDAVGQHPTQEIASLVRSCGLDHRSALRTLLDAAR